MDFRLDKTELAVEVVVKILHPRRISFLTNPKPIEACQDVRVSTRSLTLNITAFPNETLNNTQQSFSSFKIVTNNAKESSQWTSTSSNDKEIVTTNTVCAEPRPVGSTEPLQVDSLSR